ncbi:MAG: hypothetical protein AB4062_11085 [Crocosphaera sp.]
MVNERRLTPTEEGINLLNQYSGCFTIATISNIKGKIDLKLLQKSITYIQKCSSLLNCKIVNVLNSSQQKFQPLDRESVVLEIIETDNNQEWERIIINEFNQPLPLDNYLFRCLFIPLSSQNDALFITLISHTIADGLSSVKLHNLIFQQYENLSKNQINNELTTFPELTSIYYQRIEQKFPKFVGYLIAFLSLLKIKLTSQVYQIQKLKPKQVVPLEKRQGYFLNYCLETELTQKIIIKSKQEKIKVNSLLTAAILLAIADDIQFKNKSKMTLYCQCYVDLRKRLSPIVKDDFLELIVSSLISFYHLTPKSNLLSLAKEVDKKVSKALQKRAFIYYPLLLKQMIKASIADPEKSTPTVGISNLGKINFKTNYGDFILENISFVPNISIYDHSLSLSISTFHNRMTINFAFSHPSFSKQRIDNIAQRMLHILIVTSSQP